MDFFSCSEMWCYYFSSFVTHPASTIDLALTLVKTLCLSSVPSKAGLISVLLYLLFSSCVLDSFISDWAQEIKSLISMAFLSANFWLVLFCFVFFSISKLLGSAWIILLNAPSAKRQKSSVLNCHIPFSLLYQFLSSPFLDFLLNSRFVVVLKWDMTGSFYVFLTTQTILGRKALASGCRKYKSKQANSHSSRRVL